MNHMLCVQASHKILGGSFGVPRILVGLCCCHFKVLSLLGLAFLILRVQIKVAKNLLGMRKLLLPRLLGFHAAALGEAIGTPQRGRNCQWHRRGSFEPWSTLLQGRCTLCQANMELEKGPLWTSLFFEGLLFRLPVGLGECSVKRGPMGGPVSAWLLRLQA